MCVCVACVALGCGVCNGCECWSAGQCSTSCVDLETDSATDSELREGMLGGTVEADLNDRGLEAPIFSIDGKTGESSCPSWLRKVTRAFRSATGFLWVFIHPSATRLKLEQRNIYWRRQIKI